MRKVVVVMRDDNGSTVAKKTAEIKTALRGEGVEPPKQSTRTMIAELVALSGPSVLEARNREELLEVLDTNDDDVGVVLLVQQGADSYESIKDLEALRSKCGEKIFVIGVAESVRCMEEMVARRVNMLMGSPLGIIDLDALLGNIKKCTQR